MKKMTIHSWARYQISAGLILVNFLFGCIAAAEDSLSIKEWTIDGIKRRALVHIPNVSESAKSTPVVFAFHGHGGSMKNAAKVYHYHKLWDDAIIVYMQGLPTPGKTDPEGKRSGWQKILGNQNDRDLQFFDAVLATLKENHAADEKRIYVTGHSNGGGFSYLLWAERGEHLAAVAPSARGARRASNRRPLPAMHIAGEADTIVPFRNQKRTMEAVRKFNQCQSKGETWAEAGDLVATRFPRNPIPHSYQ